MGDDRDDDERDDRMMRGSQRKEGKNLEEKDKAAVEGRDEETDRQTDRRGALQ